MRQTTNCPQESTETLQSRVINNYFETTSARGSNNSEHYRIRTRGLRRGLGSWLDVKDKTIIDLGCGTGELCWLAVHGAAASVVGVNLSGGEVEIAKQHVNAEFVQTDVVEYLRKQNPNSIDCIYALNILEHLDKDRLAELLTLATVCLVPGGVLVAMVPNATSQYGAMTRYWDITHQLAFTPSSVRQLSSMCGYTAVEFREWGPRSHGPLSALRCLLWQLFRCATAFRLLVETGSNKGGIYTSDMLFRLTK